MGSGSKTSPRIVFIVQWEILTPIGASSVGVNNHHRSYPNYDAMPAGTLLYPLARYIVAKHAG